jgi:hypothetical protein
MRKICDPNVAELPRQSSLGRPLCAYQMGWPPSCAFRFGADGTLDIYFQSDNPGKDNEANWLPAPKAPFNLTMRFYSPESDITDRQMESPSHKKAVEMPPDEHGSEVLLQKTEIGRCIPFWHT